jgi:lipoate-protein ligase A
MYLRVVFFDVSDNKKDFRKRNAVENRPSVNRSSTCADIVLRPTPWTLVLNGALSGEENMREDVKLFERQRESDSVPVVRLYRWAEPTVSYGRLQTQDAAEAFAAMAGAKAVVQRPTGGGMVFHDMDLSFSVAWRRDHPTLPPCIKNVYRLFHEAMANEFRSLGIEVSLHQSGSLRQGLPGACYQTFSKDDIIWKGQKLVGGALRVASWGRLYQGNLKILPSLPSGNWDDRLINALAKGVFLRPFSRAGLGHGKGLL